MPTKSKFATIIFSFVPGVGHMYLGWMQRGLIFILTFCLAIILTGWTGISLFGLFIPVIWFYSLFDALQCYDGVQPEQTPPVEDWNWFFREQKWVGITLIVVGALIFLNKLAYPALVRLLGYPRIDMIKFLLVAILLILGGVRLAWGKPVSPPKPREDLLAKTSRQTASPELPGTDRFHPERQGQPFSAVDPEEIGEIGNTPQPLENIVYSGEAPHQKELKPEEE